MSEHRFTITITPISEEELQAFVDDFRERFGRKHLVHVIGKQPAGTHLDDAPEGMDVEAQGEMERLRKFHRENFGLKCLRGHHTRTADVIGDPNDPDWQCSHCARIDQADELTAAQAAIQRVRDVADRLDLKGEQASALFWPRAEEMRKAAKQIRRALDGDTTEESCKGCGALPANCTCEDDIEDGL